MSFLFAGHRERTPPTSPPPPPAPLPPTWSASTSSSGTAPLVFEPACSCGRLRVGPRLRCERFERWSRRCNARGVARPGRYADLVASAQRGGAAVVDEHVRKQILVDVERTCPSLSFLQTGGGGQQMLMNLLLAWVVYDVETVAAAAAPAEEEEAREDAGRAATVQVSPPAGRASSAQGAPPSRNGAGVSLVPVGYVQGMSFIAMNLLWHAGKEEGAFWVFVAMMQTYDLRSMFAPPDMHGLQMRAFTCTQLLRYAMRDLSDHLAEYLHNNLGLILSEWLLTLFASSVALGPLAELWDIFFDVGFGIIYRLILARLRCLRPWLLQERDFTQLAQLIRAAHVDFDRVDSRLVPRLRALAGSSQAETSRQQGSFLQRLVINPFSSLVPLARVPRLGFSPSLAPTSADEADGGSSFAPLGQTTCTPWTCQSCNGSEDCLSWLVLVVELAPAERAPSDMVTRFEGMFTTEKDYVRPRSTSPTSARSSPRGPGVAAIPIKVAETGLSSNAFACRPRSARPLEPTERAAAAAKVAAAAAAESLQEQLLKENADLRTENKALHSENGDLRRDLSEAHVEIEKLRKLLDSAGNGAQNEGSSDGPGEPSGEYPLGCAPQLGIEIAAQPVEPAASEHLP
eukprot:TRINITY_DN37190_c0_g1_i2.p1 TRINITY_DN37190_c0_g1~~TRINITY_DN37190_c0_g1_i2.p1  ORF type:complete len:649 (-),score=97.36 TRINITY_DN37190_c0_g1_i2:221-2107(-)